jgi:TolB protein
MKRTVALIFVLSLCVIAPPGCQSPPATVPQVAADSTQDQAKPTPAAAGPEDVSLFGNHPDAEGQPYENRLLTNMTRHTFTAVGRDFDPDLSAKVELLAFASTRNSERPDIFLKHIDGYAITQLTGDPADDIQPRFSPDGQRIVFCSNRAGNWDIWLISRDGTGLTQLTHDRTDEVAPCFSPDGTRIAFTLWGGQSHQWEIWWISVDRPGIRQFLCYGMFPDFSPDGKRIAFQRARQRGTRWSTMRPGTRPSWPTAIRRPASPPAGRRTAPRSFIARFDRPPTRPRTPKRSFPTSGWWIPRPACG